MDSSAGENIEDCSLEVIVLSAYDFPTCETWRKQRRLYVLNRFQNEDNFKMLAGKFNSFTDLMNVRWNW